MTFSGGGRALFCRWAVLSLLALASCSGSRDAERGASRDPMDCRAWVEAVPAVPELRLETPAQALGRSAVRACLVEDGVFVGQTRVPFDAARDGEALSAALVGAWPQTPEAGAGVELWAPASRRATDVRLVARAFGRAGVRVTLVGRRGEGSTPIATIDPPRAEREPPDLEGLADEPHLWVKVTPEGARIRAMDGAVIPIERKRDEPRAFWKELSERLLEQRLMAPARRRITFAPQGELSYADWAHALEIAVHEGHDAIDLTPVSVLEAQSAEIGFELFTRQGSVCLAGLDAPPGGSVEDFADSPDESEEALNVGQCDAADGEQRGKR